MMVKTSLKKFLMAVKTNVKKLLILVKTSLRQIVSWGAETIPEKVKISRPINGVKKSKMNPF